MIEQNMIETENDVKNFSYEWEMYQSEDEDEFDLVKEPQLSPDFFKNKMVLDAGCGNGRLIKFCSNLGPKMVVGIDLSDAVNVAKRKTVDNNNIQFAKSSIFCLPFKNESFDLIYSIGVLHHTPDPKEGFKSLVPLLKKGGIIVVRVYEQYHPLHQFAINTIRKVTTRIPHRIFYKICWLQQPLGEIVFNIEKISPKLAKYIKIFFFISDKKNPIYRQFAMFDWWTPKYVSFHTLEEVTKWFKECGLHQIVSLKTGSVVVKGIK